MDLQLFYRDTEQADTWMAKQEAFLANEDLGDSLDSVEALIKKHEDFEKSLAAQEEKIKALDEFATKLIDGEHYAADDVAQRRAMVRKINLKKSSNCKLKTFPLVIGTPFGSQREIGPAQSPPRRCLQAATVRKGLRRNQRVDQRKIEIRYRRELLGSHQFRRQSPETPEFRARTDRQQDTHGRNHLHRPRTRRSQPLRGS